MTQDLSLTGVSTSGSLKKKGDDWCTECKSHILVLNRVLSVLYDSLISDSFEDEDEVKAGSRWEILSPSKVMINNMSGSSLCQLFSQHCHSLVRMFCQKTKGPVKVPLTSVLKLLTRCLKVTYSDVSALPSMADLAFHLAGLHQSCMDVLGQLILCCKRDLFPFSRSIIELCLQTLMSANKMPAIPQSRTKASVYQTLVLWIQTCGWSSHFKPHSKILTQDLISSTKILERSLKMKAETTGNDVTVPSGRKKKGKKRQTNKCDSYAELGTLNDEQESTDISQDELDAVQNSLLLGRLACENLPFSSSQNLIHHIIDTTAAVQRKIMDKPKPYHVIEVRVKLYQAVAACICARLDYSCHRNDAVFHFQLTNSALGLLLTVDESEALEVRSVCSQALKNALSWENIRGPVIRKELPSEANEVEDVTDVIRERDRLSEESESLRDRLLESQMENEQQSRLISDLQKEMNRLRRETKHLQDEIYFQKHVHNDATSDIQEMAPPSAGSAVTPANQSQGGSPTENAKPDDTQPIRQRLVGSISSVNDNVEDLEEESKASAEAHPNGPDSTATVVCYDKGISLSHEAGCSKTIDVSAERLIEMKQKRVNPEDSAVGYDDAKRPRLDDKTESLEEMLLDFVDAPPDT